ncbi:hypothetical protein ABIA32_002071 [Streptacidiphilus sp. MAP12-20]|uniref:hypothetical protein n=1 Tax=Streptacidiphilus sp. MAP12-20 TaxID=3156299 RepID=UPI0035183E71
MRGTRALIVGCCAGAALWTGALPAHAAPPARAAACAGAARPSPMAVTLSGVRAAYAAGGGWSTLRLTVRNRTRSVCGQLKPVLVYGARDRTLRVDAVRLESRRGGRWQRVNLDAALGELAGQIGPSRGLSLRPGESVTLQVRMRLSRSAPHGEWLSLAVAYAPMQTKGTTVAWPVGVTNPSYFRVTGWR